MFKKLLVANRGEIACRVMRTARRLGIRTVAIYSDADAEALHVREADEAIRVGPPPSAESYIKMDAVLAAIRDSGADAVHPGYGFLSENAAFSQALEDMGVAFVGPGPDAIRAMGDKIESKRLAAKAGVSTVPGHVGELDDADRAVEVAREIGYPVMIKASAGGGGKGMRIAFDDDEAREGFRSARNEAKSSFGDDRVFIEKFVEEPRHIEIQVLADAHGNTVHLGERECSIQRRHQKVIEEAPSPFLDAETRAAMGAQAVALAQAVGYRSAGTVEFIVDKDRNFYFLEMNTRLQVEHPVTEQVTGLDLVELMLRVAGGEKLPFGQDDVRLDGWSIEARVYAEDPYRNFLPSIGRLVRYREPSGMDGVRVDAGVFEGAEISMFYDPMIAKLVTTGATREAAITLMADALDRYRIRGVGHNIDFLSAVMAHPRFREGRLSTGFIAEEFPGGFDGAAVDESTERAMRALAVAFERANAERNAMISGRTQIREAVEVPRTWTVRDAGGSTVLEIDHLEGGYQVTVGGESFRIVGDCGPTVRIFDGTVNGRPMPAQIDREELGYRVSYRGAARSLMVISAMASQMLDRMPPKEQADLTKFVLSPMPGLLVSVAVAEGEPVKAGQELAVVEAMKMENVMRAERDGVVAKIHATAGDSLAVDQAIVEFE